MTSYPLKMYELKLYGGLPRMGDEDDTGNGEEGELGIPRGGGVFIKGVWSLFGRRPRAMPWKIGQV